MQTNFNDIQFNPHYHTYKHLPTGQMLTSVTKKVSEIKPPFDAQKVAAKTVAKRKRQDPDYTGTVESVLAEWDAARAAGQERGKKVHAHIENVLRGMESQADDTFLALNETCPEI